MFLYVYRNVLMLESSKIILIKDLVEEIIEAKVAENVFFAPFRDLIIIYLQDKISHVIYSVIVI